MPIEDLIIKAADLAEDLVDAVSEPHQDWLAIERSALALAEVARRASSEEAGGTAR
jgi:hypothetical protein